MKHQKSVQAVHGEMGPAPRGRVKLTALGLTPPAATYRDSLPIEIPIPPTPKSPNPSTRDPSVTTEISISSLGTLVFKSARIWPILGRSLMERYRAEAGVW